jgi:hypothetical protein
MIASPAGPSKCSSMRSAVVGRGKSNSSRQSSSSPTAEALLRNCPPISTGHVQVYPGPQATAATEPSPFGRWSEIVQDSAPFDWSTKAGASRGQSPLDMSARKVDKVKTEPHISSKTANDQQKLSDRRESGPRADERFTISGRHIVDLDSSSDDESQNLALSGLNLAEEEQRIRYFEAMNLSLERRFSDVVQLYPSVELDSDDDGDFHERLITPGTLETPDAWLAKTPHGTMEKKPCSPSPGITKMAKPRPPHSSASSPRELETLRRMRISVNHSTSPVKLTSNPHPRLERVAFMRKEFSPPDMKDRPTSQVQSTASVIPDTVTYRATVQQGSPLLEGVPMDIARKRDQQTSNVNQEKHRRAQEEELVKPISSTILDQANQAPLLSPRGLGIVCIDSDTRQRGYFEARRPTLARSTTEPALTCSQRHPLPITDNGSITLRIPRQPHTRDEAAADRNAAATSSDVDSASGKIDTSVYTSTTSLPPLPSSARRVSIVLPPNAIKVLTNPFSPKDRQTLAGEVPDEQSRVVKRQEASLESDVSHSSQYEYRRMDSDSVDYSPSRSHSLRTRRAALHPGHPYALQAECFASTLPEGMVSFGPSYKQELSTKHRGDHMSTNSTHWPPHLNAQLSDEPLPMPASQSRPPKCSRPRLPPRHHTDTLLATSSYRRDSTVPPPAPKLPWHRMFDGPFLS